MNAKHLPLCLGYSKSSVNGGSYYYEFYLWNLGECKSHRYSESPFLPLVSCPLEGQGELSRRAAHTRKPFGPRKGPRLLLAQPVPISCAPGGAGEPRKAGVGQEGVWLSRSNHLPPGPALTASADTLVLSDRIKRVAGSLGGAVGRARIYPRSHLTRWTRRLRVPLGRQEVAALRFLVTRGLLSARSSGSVPSGTSCPPDACLVLSWALDPLHQPKKAGLGSLGSFCIACICSFCPWFCSGLVLSERTLEISTSHPNGKQRQVFCSCCGRILNMEPHNTWGLYEVPGWHGRLRSYSWFQLKTWCQMARRSPALGSGLGGSRLRWSLSLSLCRPPPCAYSVFLKRVSLLDLGRCDRESGDVRTALGGMKVLGKQLSLLYLSPFIIGNCPSNAKFFCFVTKR